MKPTQIPSLTGLRFFAAITVAVSHALPKILVYDDPPYLLVLASQTSAIGMTLFFVLSGFVVFLNYSGTIGTGVGLWNFFVARFARLYPLFFCAVAFDLLRSFSFYALPTLDSLPYYATLTQSWFFKIIDGRSLIFQFGPLSQVSWSVSTEWFFYLAFPFLCGAIGFFGSPRQKLIAITGVSVFVFSAILVLNYQSGAIAAFGARTWEIKTTTNQNSLYFWLVYFSPYVRIFEFALGCLCAALYMDLRAPSEREQWHGAWMTGAALFSLLGLQLLFFYDDWGPELGPLQRFRLNYGLAPSCALLIFCCARYRNGIVGLFSGKWIVLAGETSYSIYLLHLLVINTFRFEVAQITTWQIAVGSYLQLIVTFASILGLSLVSWRFIEVPCRRIIRSLLSISPRVSNRPAASQVPVSAP